MSGVAGVAGVAGLVGLSPLAAADGPAAASQPAGSGPSRMKDNKFSIGVLLYLRYPIPDFLGPALREMGVDFVAAHHTHYSDMSTEAILRRVRLYRNFCEKEKLRFRILVAYSEFSDEVLAEAAESRYFEGVQLQEAPWGKIIRGDGQKNPHIRPFATLKKSMSLTQALDAIEQGIAAEVNRYRKLGCRVSSNNVFPVLFHPLAKEGMDVSAKFMKESFTPVAHAIAWGAALQYDVDLWADADLWFKHQRPGHGPNELRANLLYAYWTGVSRFLVEGAGGPTRNSKAPRFKMKYSDWVDMDGLVVLDGDKWKLSKRGEVLRDFARDYIPKHPRKHTFREVQPDIAIVRFPDAQCGMEWGKNAFGVESSPSAPPESKHLLKIWNLLTHGKSGHHMTFFTRKGNPSFFFPLNGVVVFDHRVTYRHLDDIPLIVLTGTEVSAETQQSIAKCVSKGATCVTSTNLAPNDLAHQLKPGDGPLEVARGSGRWILTADFSEEPLKEILGSLIGRTDEIRYRFRDGPDVRFRMEDDDPNLIRVNIE